MPVEHPPFLVRYTRAQRRLKARALPNGVPAAPLRPCLFHRFACLIACSSTCRTATAALCSLTAHCVGRWLFGHSPRTNTSPSVFVFSITCNRSAHVKHHCAFDSGAFPITSSTFTCPRRSIFCIRLSSVIQVHTPEPNNELAAQRRYALRQTR